MFAVIFEVMPSSLRKSEYLDIARVLAPEVQKIDGFLENERFRKDGDEGSLLSLSLWRDEKALIRWRTQEVHHRAQGRGRAGVLADYRLRVGEVVLEANQAGLKKVELPRADLTEVSDAKLVSISIVSTTEDVSRLSAGDAKPQEGAWYTSITDVSKRLLLGSWSDAPAAHQWIEQRARGGPGLHYGINVIRVYGMHDRREASLFHPPV